MIIFSLCSVLSVLLHFVLIFLLYLIVLYFLNPVFFFFFFFSTTFSGMPVPLYERRELKFFIRNFSAIQTSFNIFARTFIVLAIWIVSTCSNAVFFLYEISGLCVLLDPRSSFILVCSNYSTYSIISLIISINVFFGNFNYLITYFIHDQLSVRMEGFEVTLAF